VSVNPSLSTFECLNRLHAIWYLYHATEPISTVYFINPPISLCVCIFIVLLLLVSTSCHTLQQELAFATHLIISGTGNPPISIAILGVISTPHHRKVIITRTKLNKAFLFFKHWKNNTQDKFLVPAGNIARCCSSDNMH
jgi:hypothetical protein